MKLNMYVRGVRIYVNSKKKRDGNGRYPVPELNLDLLSLPHQFCFASYFRVMPVFPTRTNSKFVRSFLPLE